MEEKNIQAEVVNEANEKENAKALDTIKAKAAGFWTKNKKKILIGAGITAAALVVYALCKAASNDSISSIDALDINPKDDFDDSEFRKLIWEERGLEAKYQKACDMIKNVGNELDLAPDERIWFTGILQGDNYSVDSTEEAGIGGWFEIDGTDISRPSDLA